MSIKKNNSNNKYTNMSNHFGIVPSDLQVRNLFIAEKIPTSFPQRDNSKTFTNVGPAYSFGFVPSDASYTYYTSYF
jgi:hypothetical protein